MYSIYSNLSVIYIKNCFFGLLLTNKNIICVPFRYLDLIIVMSMIHLLNQKLHQIQIQTLRLKQIYAYTMYHISLSYILVQVLAMFDHF